VAGPDRLSLVLGDYPHVAGLTEAFADRDDVRLERVEAPSLQDAFKRMCREVCYDVCEMSITGYLLARRYGLPFTALPVFTARGFPQSHASIVVRSGADIATPRDLEGKRVGARSYSGTASLWVRGVLQDEYRVEIDRVIWVSAEEDHVLQYTSDLPGNVALEPGCDLASMLEAGDLDAAIGIPAGKDGRFTPLIRDARSAAKDFYRLTGIYQINHTVVVRDDVLERHPELPQRLLDAFVGAKQRWLSTTPDLPLAEELGLPEGDLFPYGLEANAPSIDALLRYAKAQKLITDDVTADTLFPLQVE
jgi:4,5-dihydroxyphthalate decarboxylase